MTDPRDVADEACGEILVHDESNDCVALAPHGGGIEPHTDDQAFRVADALDCSAWAFLGHVDGGGARDRFYENSTDVDPTDYRLLGRIAGGEPFEYAVAVHGYTEDGVYVGGTADPAVRRRLADRIGDSTGLQVQVARRGDGLCRDYGGTDPRNLVNRLGATSLQLEQSRPARDDHWEGIADVVAAFLADPARR